MHQNRSSLSLTFVYNIPCTILILTCYAYELRPFSIINIIYSLAQLHPQPCLQPLPHSNSSHYCSFCEVISIIRYRGFLLKSRACSYETSLTEHKLIQIKGGRL